MPIPKGKSYKQYVAEKQQEMAEYIIAKRLARKSSSGSGGHSNVGEFYEKNADKNGFMGPQPVPEEKITGGEYSAEVAGSKKQWDKAYQQREDYKKYLKNQISNISPSGVYVYNGERVHGVFLKTELTRELVRVERDEGKFQQGYSNIREAYMGSLELPVDTSVTKIGTDERSTYKISVPSTSTPEYRAMQRNPISLFATSLTLEDPLGLKSAYYMATGDKERAVGAKVSAIRNIKNLSNEGLWGFTKFYFTNPITLIAGSSLIGAGLGAASTAAKGYLVGKGLYAGASAVTAMEVGVGSAVVGSTALDIYQTSKTDPGGAFAKLGLTGFMFASGYAGYKTGAKIGRGIAETKLQNYYKAHPEKIRMYNYRLGERVDYKITGKYESRMGTPVEKNKVSVLLQEIYKPTRTRITSSKPYHTGLQSYSQVRSVRFDPTVTVSGSMQTKTGLLSKMLSIRKLIYLSLIHI